ncbi:helix-turn-helix domain-containing protein [Nocardia sp. NPDC005998]|uniref:helix-turn-helix domain-containing protein n=1 Tax=Nocardia sp. NPDC005998 TaxID=3156894 RepID=UPI0033BE179D
MNPIDLGNVRLLRNSLGDYIVGPPAQTGVGMLWELKVVDSPTMPLGTMLMGNSDLAARVFIRQNMFVMSSNAPGFAKHITSSVVNGEVDHRCDSTRRDVHSDWPGQRNGKLDRLRAVRGYVNRRTPGKPQGGLVGSTGATVTSMPCLHLPIGRSVGAMSVVGAERLKNARKRAAMTQRDLAAASGVSLSQIRKIEQGEYEPRLETLRMFAVAMNIRTSQLQEVPDYQVPDIDTSTQWEAVFPALFGKAPQPDEPATAAGVQAVLDGVQAMISADRYREVTALLPSLLRDVDSLGDARAIRFRVLNLTASLLAQTRQFDAADMVLSRAIDAAENAIEAATVIDTMLWALLRQGRLDDARSMAIKWADDIEPRFSRASLQTVAIWGRLWLKIANAAVRDNQPGEVEDALSMARAAAYRIGRDIYAERLLGRTFGPLEVAYISAESFVIAGEPEKTLAIAGQVPIPAIEPTGASRLRHRLDVANAHTQLGHYGDALDEMRRVQRIAPEWLVQQRYSRDILGKIVAKRRTLTPEMRELANGIQLEY